MTSKEQQIDISFTQNRELSWLRFNERVLEEATDPGVPLFEQLRFVHIFTANLDEFFMIRVGSLFDLSLLHKENVDNKSGMTAQEQLKAIYQAVTPLYKMRDAVYSHISVQLAENGICNVAAKELDGEERKYLAGYFESFVLPVLSPQIIDAHHPFPHIENKSLNIGLMLRAREGRRFGIIPLPRSLPRLVFLPGKQLRYVLMEELIYEHAEHVFDMYHTEGKMILCVTRNADINPDDDAYEISEDFRLHMKKVLKKRARLAPVRLEIQHKADASFLQYLCDRLDLKKEQVFQSAAPLDLSYLAQLEEKLPPAEKKRLLYPPFTPQKSPAILPKESLQKQIMRGDVLLNYPYESMDHFLLLIKEASADPAVLSIKISLYRIDRKSKLAEHLISAAENGKDVTVLMELRARFDEQNNIDWAERLEEAGCKVIYGFESFKVHAKICLITRREKNRLQYITQLGTGNYNEKTAALYSDLSLLTANQGIGRDAALFFKNMSISNLNGNYSQLLVAPSSFKRLILALIDGEIDKVRRGRPAGILFKLNSLTDRDILDKLSQASRGGVQVQLLIRGICCILPGIPDRTENISVVSIVGRFLEHARIYVFGAARDAQVYIASADLMTRNTERRVETACPILDAKLRERILDLLNIQLRDNVKSRRLLPDGSYEPILPGEGGRMDSQSYFIEEARQNAPVHAETGGRLQKLQALIRSRFGSPREARPEQG